MLRRAPLLVLAGLVGVLAPTLPVGAQVPPPGKQLRTYVPPDQLVSFPPETPFDQFVDSLSVIFARVAGKRLVDLEERTVPIGIPVGQMQFLDALELVLGHHGLTYRETERYLFVEKPRRRE